MGKKIDHFFTKPLYPYLYGFVFLSYKTAQYYPSFSLMDAFNFMLLFCIGCYIMHILLKPFTSKLFRGIGVIFFFISLLHVVTVAQFLGYSFSYIPATFYLLFYFIVLFLIPLIPKLVTRNFASKAILFNKVMNTFFIILSVVFLLNGFIYAERQKTKLPDKQIRSRQVSNLKNKFDVIWILLDEYGSSKTLLNNFNFHNPLDSLLAKKGFFVLSNMKSRFDNTLYSLNAIFNNDDSVRPINFYAGVHALKNSRWLANLSNSGYQFINIGLFDIGSSNKFSDRSSYPQNYQDQLLSGTAFNMLNLHFKYSLINCDNYINRVVNKLGHEMKDTSAQVPRFIWAHISIPHEPFCRNSHGVLLKETSYNENDSALIKSGYIDYLSYGNTIVEKLLENNKELSNKIIIISGDHGPRYPFLSGKDHRIWPFAAIKFPTNPDTASLGKLTFISQLPDFVMNYLSKAK